MRKLTQLSILLAFIFALPALSYGGGLAPFTDSDVPPAPDYATKEAWLAQAAQPGKHEVDIFWVYPTILADNQNWLMDSSSPSLQKLAAGTLIKQASVFSSQANLYAPYYRQMNMAALSMSPEKQEQLLSYGKDDVLRAFLYYLKYQNDGRPFIIAGHSQGSDLLLMLLREKWGRLGVEDQLVAAYLIGWSITDKDLKANRNLQMCEDANQTGCFISYNTVAQGRQNVAPTILEGALVVNPLTWKTNGKFAPASRNHGARFFAADGTSKDYKHFTSAQIEDGGLVVDPADPSLVAIDSPTFPKGVFHPFDYSLFYDNIKQNVGHRIRVYLDALDTPVLSPAP